MEILNLKLHNVFVFIQGTYVLLRHGAEVSGLVEGVRGLYGSNPSRGNSIFFHAKFHMYQSQTVIEENQNAVTA
jgi:hypothetical protein